MRILAVRADEEGELAREAAGLLARRPAANAELTIPVAVSARHAHLSSDTVDRLFGVGYRLRKRGDLSQPGQYSAEETVTLIGPRGRVERVRLMGPPRSADQIEISRSDEFVLGVDAPVRLSGDLSGTPGITLEGPRGRVTIERGVICARRHIHASPRRRRSARRPRRPNRAGANRQRRSRSHVLRRHRAGRGRFSARAAPRCRRGECRRYERNRTGDTRRTSVRPRSRRRAITPRPSSAPRAQRAHEQLLGFGQPKDGAPDDSAREPIARAQSNRRERLLQERNVDYGDLQ